MQRKNDAEWLLPAVAVTDLPDDLVDELMQTLGNDDGCVMRLLAESDELMLRVSRAIVAWQPGHLLAERLSCPDGHCAHSHRQRCSSSSNLADSASPSEVVRGRSTFARAAVHWEWPERISGGSAL